ncbi:TonB-dependent receptor [Lysobacter sp. 22409]|uniref:TonB-dependent receptor n=1 Tax=Lysobacter sp. 22409 TaxID=3453917 RepID=UPI003F85E867
MNGKTLRKSGLCMAMGICLASMALQPALAANTDGSLAGRVTAGAEVTVRSTETGFTRTVKADESGNYRFPFLPIGTYQLQASKDGAAVGEPIEVVVSLGNEANINLGDATNLGAVQVIGSRVISPVDVRSTESATNVTREELSRLPVERDPLAVALLAPGLTKGDNDLGGISFGGSSVAENSVYINGLNVTDFYNRVGFSSVPFGFYKEFQVKTGGYSVEFGRTTGGVINAVTRSGTNEFQYGAEFVWEPRSGQSKAKDRYANGRRYLTYSYDDYDRSSLNVFASGPIVRDKLFFFAMYEARDYQPNNTDDRGTTLTKGDADNGFWGTKLDWQINDKHLLEFLAFSDKDETVSKIYGFNADTGKRSANTDTTYSHSGGKNWALTYTGYLTDAFSAKAMYGKNERNRATSSLTDINCNRVVDSRDIDLDIRTGCTNSSLVEEAVDDREAMRLDFEWSLGNHLLRFGVDREKNTSDYQRSYPGAGGFRYDIGHLEPGRPLPNPGGGVAPPSGDYIRARRLEVDGTFETINSAYYVEDNWQITPDLMLNAGLRVEAFDNKDSEGRSYIKIDDMLAPRLGFSWDFNGDGRTKVFGNLGRYFLPVANVINIKQAGGFLDERTYYAFGGYEVRSEGGQDYLYPILGPQIGPVDNSQGDGSVGDLRGEVDADMDPVYQDELILGFQTMLGEKWSWGLRGIYRKLHNAIDDMEITSNGLLCDGEPGEVGFVMANPGKTLKVYTDTNCDGVNDGYVDIDTSRAGWAMYDDDGNYLGDRGWDKPKRTYRALEFVVDRAWDDKWEFNASYTWSQTKGNAEGPVTSDFNFADAGRTEAFDNPWVNYGAYGYLPNDRRHQIKARGTYAINDHWQVGATLSAQSGRPISAMGVGNPFDGTIFHSFFICVENCDAAVASERVYQLYGRGSAGRTPWTYDVGASLTYQRAFGRANFKAKLAVYNLFNQQRTIEVDEEGSGDPDATFLRPVGFQTPRYSQLTLSVNF